MKFYNFHIGDYASHTSHLSLTEDLVYRRMLDLYYSTEKPLPNDGGAIARLIRLRDNPIEVLSVLHEFFTETPQGWINNGADKVIRGFKKMSEGGKIGAGKRWGQQSKNGVGIAPLSEPHTPPHQDPNANHKPITINHKPRKRELVQAPTDADFWSEMAVKFTHINISAEQSKMEAWLSVNRGRKLTRKFAVNWLNRVEAPLTTTSTGSKYDDAF